MNYSYFKEQLALYQKEALKRRSEHIIDMYRKNPEILAHELIQRGFFERVSDDQKMSTIRDTATDLLSELGVMSRGRELDVVRALLDVSQVPEEYLKSDEVGGSHG